MFLYISFNIFYLIGTERDFMKKNIWERDRRKYSDKECKSKQKKKFSGK